MKIIYAVALSMLLVGCGQESGKVPKTASVQQQAPTASQGGIAAEQRQVMEQTKGVEAGVNQSAEEERKKIDEQSQ